ncbi:hypothetical protein PIB30_031363 [Stylosanthes scabra]|uniref:Uncharacterized protein n=1 Tax=Stylosanthes scabra TaxID=79078 RepID=A0ABU6WAB0_9FABA|nr:hypothetical protein [Stylosanthes scabra]
MAHGWEGESTPSSRGRSRGSMQHGRPPMNRSASLRVAFTNGLQQPVQVELILGNTLRGVEAVTGRMKLMNFNGFGDGTAARTSSKSAKVPINGGGNGGSQLVDVIADLHNRVSQLEQERSVMLLKVAEILHQLGRALTPRDHYTQ